MKVQATIIKGKYQAINFKFISEDGKRELSFACDNSLGAFGEHLRRIECFKFDEGNKPVAEVDFNNIDEVCKQLKWLEK